MEINITTIALFVTSVATVAYATLTYFLLRETRREKKKPIIEEILGVVLYPLKYFLGEELKDFKNGNARLRFIKGKFEMGTKISTILSWGATALVCKDFKKIHPDIAELNDKHDDLITELENKANMISKKLYTPNFKNKCRELIDEWDKEVDKNRRLSQAYPGDSLSEMFISFVVNNIEELLEGHVFLDFWKEKHDIFFKEKEKIAEKECEDLKKSLKKLSNFTEYQLSEIDKLIEKYQKKYGFSPKYIDDKYEISKFYI